MASRRLHLGWRARTYSLTFAALIALLLTGRPLAFGQSIPTFDSVNIGSFDPDAWNGVVFLTRSFSSNRKLCTAGRIGIRRWVSGWE